MWAPLVPAPHGQARPSQPVLLPPVMSDSLGLFSGHLSFRAARPGISLCGEVTPMVSMEPRPLDVSVRVWGPWLSLGR